MRWTDLSKVVWLCALALLASPCLKVRAADEPVAKLAWKDGAAKVAGKLTSADAKDKVRKQVCKIYALPLKAGTSYRIDMASKRYMVKMFLLDFWKAWRGLEGLSVGEPYAVAKLGYPRHGEAAE